MKQLRLAAAGLLVLALAINGCSKNPADSGDVKTGGDFEVKVKISTTPEYSWTTGNAFSVSVVRTSNPTEIVWGLTSPVQSNIQSPLTHGEGRPGAIPTANKEPKLQSGVEYRVSVTLKDGKTGWTDFTVK